MLGDPGKTVPSFVSSHNIGGVITDFSPLREARNWLDEVVKAVPEDVPVFEVSFLGFISNVVEFLVFIYKSIIVH